MRKNPEHNVATPSEPSMSRGRSVSKKRSMQGKSNHGAILRQPCRSFLKGTCTRSLECQFYKQKRAAKPGINVCSRIMRLMNKQTKAEEWQLFPQKKRKRRQECCGYCEMCATIGLRLARLGSIGFSQRETASGKPEAWSFGIDSTSTIHTVYATSSKYPGKQRTIAWENTSQ